MEIVFDEMGPQKIVHVYDPKLKFHGFLVIDSSAKGTGMTQVRFASTANTTELARLARTVTLKNALLGLSSGGAYAEIIADPAELSERRKKAMLQALALLVKPLIALQPEEDAEEIGLGAGLVTVAALAHAEIAIEKSQITIAGYGEAGKTAHKFLQERGAKIVAISDANGTLYDRRGIDFAARNHPNAKKLTREVIYELSTDALVITSGTDVINETNVARVKANCIIEASDNPMSEDIEKQLHRKDMLVIPDILATTAGTYKKKSMATIAHVLEIVGKGATSPRDVAFRIAKARLKK